MALILLAAFCIRPKRSVCVGVRGYQWEGVRTSHTGRASTSILEVWQDLVPTPGIPWVVPEHSYMPLGKQNWMQKGTRKLDLIVIWTLRLVENQNFQSPTRANAGDDNTFINCASNTSTLTIIIVSYEYKTGLYMGCCQPCSSAGSILVKLQNPFTL